MQKPRAIYYEILNYDAANLELLRRSFDVVTIPDPRADTDESLAQAEVLFAPLGFVVDRERLNRCPRLRVVASNTTGIPHIDVNEAERRGIAICALHNEQAFLETITPTAEHAIGLILAAQRRIPATHRAASNGDWSRWPWGAPKMLSRMRLGLIGLGRIGKRVAAVAKALGMDVGYFDPNVAGGYPTIIDLARRSEVLSLHAPANADTRKLISREVIYALPRGAILVNTARGELLDTDALLDALSDGHLYAAALDTIDGEYEPDFAATFGNSAIAAYARAHDNLILTPHIGGSTVDAWALTQERIIRKTMAVFGIGANA